MSDLENKNEQHLNQEAQQSGVVHSTVVNHSANVVNKEEDKEDKKKMKKTKDDPFQNITILNEPNRKLPKVIEEALANDIPVRLSKNGYYIAGFYGLNSDTDNAGFAFAQETSEPDALVFYDSKNHRHLVKTFEDLVKFHNHVWGLFFKVSEEYKKPDILWFGFMLQYGVLNIMPGSVK